MNITQMLSRIRTHSYCSRDNPNAVLYFATFLINLARLPSTFVDSHHQCLLDTSSGRKDDSQIPGFDRVESRYYHNLVFVRRDRITTVPPA